MAEYNQSDDDASTELLAYYRARIEEFEKEREEFLKRFADVEAAHEQLHRAKWDIRVKEEEIAELQRGLSDANIYLFDEREQVLKLQAENDQLKVQEMEDRRRIQHLLSLTQPVTQEVTFYRDARPNKMTRFTGSNSLQNSNNAKINSSAAILSSAHQSTVKNQSLNNNISSINAPSGEEVVNNNQSENTKQISKNRVLRTIYLPSEQADSLVLAVESMQHQLDETKKLAAGRTAALLEDRRVREDEFSSGRERLSALVNKADEELSNCQDILRRTTKDYLILRHNSQVQHRMMSEESEQLKAANQRLVKQLQELKREASMQTEAIRSAAEEESEEFANQFRNQAKAREEDLAVLKDQYNQVQSLYEKKVNSLESKLSNLKNKYKSLEKRRNLELEGFKTDVTQLRNQTRRLESLWLTAGGMLHNTNFKLTHKSEQPVGKLDAESAANELLSLRARLGKLEREITSIV